MNRIHLQQTLPQVFAGRDTVTSQIWHQNIVFSKGKRYLVEAASGTGKSSLCSYIYGYRQDYQGIINFDEQNIRSLSVNEWADIRKHSLSILFQELRIFPELTALENVLLNISRFLHGPLSYQSLQSQEIKISGIKIFLNVLL